MRAPGWQLIRRTESARYRINSYRVLLTRAREGLCIYVPTGCAADPTRTPQEFDAIADTLVAAGCMPLAHSLRLFAKYELVPALIHAVCSNDFVISGNGVNCRSSALSTLLEERYSEKTVYLTALSSHSKSL